MHCEYLSNPLSPQCPFSFCILPTFIHSTFFHPLSFFLCFLHSYPIEFFALSLHAHFFFFVCGSLRLHLFSVPVIFLYSYLRARVCKTQVCNFCVTEFSSFLSAYFVTLVFSWSYTLFHPITHCFSSLLSSRLSFNQQVLHVFLPFKTSSLFSAILKCNTFLSLYRLSSWML